MRIWRVVTREDFVMANHVTTQDIGIINFMTLDYAGCYYVYHNNLQVLLDNENYKI